MVSTSGQANGGPTSGDLEQQKDIDITLQHQPCSLTYLTLRLLWLSCIKGSLTAQGITGEPLDIICGSWRQGTQKQYSSNIKAWMQFCEGNKVCPTKASLQQALVFLTELSKK